MPFFVHQPNESPSCSSKAGAAAQHKIHDMTFEKFSKWKDAVVLNRIMTVTELVSSEARLCGGPLPPSFPESKRA